ncbi:intraflagellar transport protein 172 homolog isoform X1 [Ostrinia furnacalis]|uniref:intraflagellar transport protein 172 homolog isoform X1 n=1 Tax=Ostrinia furnacalis TaxID=93504 RepID=UPI00103A9DD7|nr:intraflagellar transport protein 172 homolog isoform X1 [Ostrinia furnacalis]
MPHLHAARALAWSGDGTKLALASQAGAVIQLEAVLRRWVWRDSVEVQHVSSKQLVLTRLANDAPPLTVTTKQAPDIFNVRFIGNDWYAVCRTASTLILCDIAHGLTSEIPWAGGGERVYAAVGGACLLHRAGELSVVEYGLDRVLHTVRTERVNPHVLSVRINEGGDTRKHLAYLLDRQTIAVVDLTTGVQLGQWWHEARVDWLELNETGQLLLLRDTRRRLALLRLETGDKEIIASGVGFVQWIENCDAVVAQTPTHLLIWYSVWEADSAEMAECSGGVAVEVNARRVLFEGGQVPYLQLDEHRLAFNNALRSGDLAGCAKYLDGVGNNADVASLWRQLAERALATDDIQLAAKCYREVGDEARMFYLDKTVELAASVGDGDVAAGLNVATVRARLSIFAGDLPSAEEWYVKKAGKPELAIDMYKQFNRWAEAVALAEKTDRAAVAMLKQQHMDYLTSTGRLGEAGAALASSGDVQGAVRLWLRGGRARRAAALLLQHASLLRDTELVDAVHTQLVQEEWWEMAGEISERRGDSRTAVEYYAKGNNFARAVQLAREACPAEVTSLEGMWGSWLVSSRQAGAAVPHLIEAGDTRGALAAALKAHHYRKALQIVQVIEDKESIREQCEQLGDHFISTQEWETAERILSSCGMAERCVRAYNTAGRVADGLRLAAQHLTEEETRDIYLPLAQQMREDGQLRKAEQIYIGLGEPDEAISMYKEASQYEAMLRLVAAHRSSLLEATRRHVAQALHASGDLRAAENYYIQAGDWKAAIQMYRSAGQWEGAERVARAHAPSSVQQQVALQWAGALGGAPAARLLAARGLAALGARWALQAQRWDIALELSELGGGVTKREVARHEAAALADEQPEAAEAAFLRAAAPDDAVRMWLARGQHQRALVLAEQHASHMVEEVLVEGARAAAERGDLAQFETLMIRANRPREVVQHYKDLELWDEASRVSREYLPDGGEPVPSSVPPLLQRAADHADRGEWWEAVELLISASAAGANGGAARLAERAALRAARLARDHLHDQRRRAAAEMLYERFAAIGQSDIGEQLRAALTDGYSGDEEAAGPSNEYQEEEEVTVTQVRETSEDAEGAALERLARAGHWQRCLAHAGPRAPHYALRYAVHLFKAHPRMEGIDIESEDVPEALSQVLEVLRQYLVGDAGPDTVVSSADTALARGVCGELLARASCAPRALRALQDTANVLRAAGADDRAMQAITLLMALHVAQVAGRAARALPRYSDIVVADVAYYASGVAIRAEGSGGSREAFVLLNRCLDLAEAADEDSAHMLDYTDFECTDWSRTPLLLESACVRGAPLDDIREWVLAVSMDQAVEQTLPVDSRGQYGAALGAGEACCVLTGYPLGSRLVTFTNVACSW